MKLIVQIPCLNEEETLPLVLKSIPKVIDGIDEIETLVIDDGSTDRTCEVARRYGVTHILHHKTNKGLARSFSDGIHFALTHGADIIVNTDADNQYPQEDIPRLIEPILNDEAEMVIADRQIPRVKHFSWLKKRFQRVGTRAVRMLSGASVPDAVSGFRAYSRNAAMQLNIVTDFSYVIETIIQAQYKKISIASIKVMINPPTRESRLFKNMFDHMKRSGTTMLRIYTMYSALRIFMMVGFLVGLIGLIATGRFFVYVLIGQGAGHVQSIIFGGILLIAGVQIFMTGVVADLIGINRRLAEDVLRKMKVFEYNQKKEEQINTTTLDYVKKIPHLNGDAKLSKGRFN